MLKEFMKEIEMASKKLYPSPESKKKNPNPSFIRSSVWSAGLFRRLY